MNLLVTLTNYPEILGVNTAVSLSSNGPTLRIINNTIPAIACDVHSPSIQFSANDEETIIVVRGYVMLRELHARPVHFIFESPLQ